MVHGGNSLVKYLLFFFNFLFVVTGIILIAVGAVVKTNASKYVKYLGTEATSVSIFLIVVGVIVFFIAFLGCCGAIKENHCMIMTFAVLLFIIFIFEIAGGIAAYVFRNKIHTLLDEGLKNQISHYGPDNSSDWDDIQQELKCCGSTNVTDWWDLNPLYENHSFPKSCCYHLPPDTACNQSLSIFNNKPCLSAIEDVVNSNLAKIGGAGIGIGFVEVVGIIFSCCLARAIRKQYETV